MPRAVKKPAIPRSAAAPCNPGKAADAAGFDYFAIGVPGHDAIDALAARLTERGDPHDGVHRTPVGCVLLGLRDPDGHDIRFYTVPLEFPPGFSDHATSSTSPVVERGSSQRANIQVTRPAVSVPSS